MAYTGWELPSDERERLLALIPAVYPHVVAHHVTLAFGVPADEAAPAEAQAHVVGVADDGSQVQALVVAIDGRVNRPDGKVFHITWSLDRDKGVKPVHSNDVIEMHGFVALATPLPVRVTPRVFVAG